MLPERPAPTSSAMLPGSGVLVAVTPGTASWPIEPMGVPTAAPVFLVVTPENCPFVFRLVKVEFTVRICA